MIKLTNLLKEILKINDLNLGDKYISANDLSKKLEPNPEKIYDFGGGKFSNFGDETIVIDAFDVPKNSSNQIHDLNQYIKLPPRNLINMSYSFYNFQNSSEIKKTVEDALKSGGYLVVQDYNNTLEKIKSIFKNYNILYENVSEGDPEEDDEGFYVIVFQK
tara:strand:- start:5014 stop:5496 length:483 start_codon:yes stop_codon:yes gene_type:complete